MIKKSYLVCFVSLPLIGVRFNDLKIELPSSGYGRDAAIAGAAVVGTLGVSCWVRRMQYRAAQNRAAQNRAAETQQPARQEGDAETATSGKLADLRGQNFLDLSGITEGSQEDLHASDQGVNAQRQILQNEQILFTYRMQLYEDNLALYGKEVLLYESLNKALAERQRLEAKQEELNKAPAKSQLVEEKQEELSVPGSGSVAGEDDQDLDQSLAASSWLRSNKLSLEN